jgi:transcriptional regulator with XRE-family HTH domain
MLPLSGSNSKLISMQTIGERFEDARKKKGISIREAAEATKIRGDYLQKFESNHFDIGLTEIYTRGFLRNYAGFLKLPADRILNDYTALGRSESRPRPANREIYGRLDVSTPAAEDSESSAPTAEGGDPAAPPVRPTPQRARTGSSLPTGPDPALVFKYTKWVLIGVGVLVAVFFIRWLFVGSKPAETAKAPATAAAARGPVLGLIATNPVQVTVKRKNADESEGEVIFSGMLNPGESKSVPRIGAVYVEASAAENLQIEINGKRYNLGQLLGNGYQRGQLPAP